CHSGRPRTSRRSASRRPRSDHRQRSSRRRRRQFREGGAGMSTQAEKQDPTPVPQRKRSWPAISEDTEFFWNGVRDGELRVQQCSECSALSHPPKPICSACGSFELGHLAVSGAGTVYSHVTFHKPPSPGFDEPYNVSVIELAEGVRLVS